MKPSTHTGSRRVGDAEISMTVQFTSGSCFAPGFPKLMADITVTHPVSGSVQNLADFHRWNTRPVTNATSKPIDVASNAKYKKHAEAYNGLDILFVACAASTYGVLHPEFLRFLYLHALMLSPELAVHQVGIGELREQGSDVSAPDRTRITRALFAKLSARVTSLVACSTGVRIFGQSTKGRRWFPSQFQALDAPDPLFSLFDKVSLPGVVPVG